MCKGSRTLSRISPHRFIAYCDCCGGIVHLAWDNLTLALSPQDFRRLNEFFTHHAEPPKVQEEGVEVVLYQRESPSSVSVRLWIGNVGLRLERLGWGELRHLCFLASQTLGLPELRPETPTARPRQLN
ncbi:hypothetical protein Mrose_01620 [Calidithermus roseus]|uniref:Uncharacterized protein n=1 Tax=Calidithermus roseus TaxID=1644118 RepID=A0A399ET72_9DEIN|nr:hypothetical protein Mrose_01620 [Calidithermus roseus]